LAGGNSKSYENFEILKFDRRTVGSAAMVQEAPLKNICARGRIIFLFFPSAARARALKIRQPTSASLKVPDGAWKS
jgi:hypothetical protein